MFKPIRYAGAQTKHLSRCRKRCDDDRLPDRSEAAVQVE